MACLSAVDGQYHLGCATHMGKDKDAKDPAALRWSTLGDTLHESLKVMVDEKRVSKREARAILVQFDKASAHPTRAQACSARFWVGTDGSVWALALF